MEKNSYTVSVCMATYNGMVHISEQLESILQQLSTDDELVISDDHSTDGTWEYLKKLAANDHRIRLFQNPKTGVINNFEHAILQTKNELIFLSDQDDIWKENKVAVMSRYFAENSRIQVIVSDLVIINNQKEILVPSYQAMRKTRNGFWQNWLRSSYIGAAMAFRRELKEKILPIPATVPMHDMWIGLLADKKRQVMFIPEKLVYYRRHDHNVTEIKTTASRLQQLKWRKDILWLLFRK